MAIIKLNTRSLADNSVTTPKIADTVNLGRRNILHNGAMQVAQRGDVSGAGVDTYVTDRWKQFATVGGMDGRATYSQVTDAPSGFEYSMKIQVTTSETPSANEEYTLQQRVEAQNIKHLEIGSSGAKSITLSFYAKSNSGAAGTYSAVVNTFGGGAYVEEFTVTTSWQRFEINVPATTDSNNATSSSGTGTGIGVGICLMAGSSYNGATSGQWNTNPNAHGTANTDNLFSTVGNELYVTGFQLEANESATPFEHRSYGEELELCQRYYRVIGDGSSSANVPIWQYQASYRASIYHFPEMRTAPSLSTFGTATNFDGYDGSSISKNHVFAWEATQYDVANTEYWDDGGIILRAEA